MKHTKHSRQNGRESASRQPSRTRYTTASHKRLQLATITQLRHRSHAIRTHPCNPSWGTYSTQMRPPGGIRTQNKHEANTTSCSSLQIAGERESEQRAKTHEYASRKLQLTHELDNVRAGQTPRAQQTHHTTVQQTLFCCIHHADKLQKPTHVVTKRTTNTTQVFETVTSATCTANRTHAPGKEYSNTDIHLTSAECRIKASTTTRRFNPTTTACQREGS